MKDKTRLVPKPVCPVCGKPYIRKLDAPSFPNIHYIHKQHIDTSDDPNLYLNGQPYSQLVTDESCKVPRN